MNNVIVNIPLTTSEVDIILNALEEKTICIKELYNSIYNITSEQLVNKEEINNMQNNMIVCKDCGKEFEFTLGEQKFFEEKGFASPVRCKTCRDAKKKKNEEVKQNNFEEMLKKFQENTVQF